MMNIIDLEATYAAAHGGIVDNSQIVLQGGAPQIVLGVNPKTMPNYKSVADLRGKKIGVSAPGSSTNMMANLVLSRAGIKP